MANPLSPELDQLSKRVQEFAESVDEPAEKQDLLSASERLAALAAQLESWRLQEIEGGVYWIESSINRFSKQNVSLMAAPIDVGPALRENLFDKTDCCILTSATLAIGSNSFDFFQNRIGSDANRNAETGQSV